MFDTVQYILDVFGRPVFVLPQEVKSDKCDVAVYHDCIEFFAEQNKIGRVDNIAPEILALVASQNQVGLIAWDDIKTKKCPSSLTHVAHVHDNRELPA